MKGSNLECKFCGSEDLKVNRANETIQCENCDRILEERYNDFRAMSVNFERDSPYCVETADALRDYKFPTPLEGDPFHSSGFITAFSHISVQQLGAFTLTSRTFPGDLADLERILNDLDVDCTPPPPQQPGVPKMKRKDNPTTKLRHILTANFVILEVGELMGFNREDCDEALRLFKRYSETNNVRTKGAESLAVAALVIIDRQNEKARDLSEFVAVSGILQKDLIQGTKAMQQSISAATVPNRQCISLHMPQFCKLLGMQPSSEALAMQMGENAGENHVCTRRNPISIAAAAIYLACNLDDQKKTQIEICKVTGLTEVTLRKVYKELLSQHEKVIPPNYKSKIPIRILLPPSMANKSKSSVEGKEKASDQSQAPQEIQQALAALLSEAQGNPQQLLFPQLLQWQQMARMGQISQEQLKQQVAAMGLDPNAANLSQAGLPNQGAFAPQMFANFSQMAGLSGQDQNQLYMQLQQALGQQSGPGSPSQPPAHLVRSFQQMLEQQRFQQAPQPQQPPSPPLLSAGQSPLQSSLSQLGGLQTQNLAGNNRQQGKKASPGSQSQSQSNTTSGLFTGQNAMWPELKMSKVKGFSFTPPTSQGSGGKR